MCKRSNTFSLAVLIGRGLDHNLLGYGSCATTFPHNIYFCFVQFSGYINPFIYTALSECGIFLFCGELSFDTGRFLTGLFSFSGKFLMWDVFNAARLGFF